MQRDASRLEIRNISRDHRHAMNQGSCGDKRVPFGTRVWNVQLRTTLGDGGIDRQHAAVERRQHLMA